MNYKLKSTDKAVLKVGDKRVSVATNYQFVFLTILS